MLEDFRARGFRTFEDLEIPRLGRVNLIVGRNNVGKTMLLHALRIFRARGVQHAIVDMLDMRDEVGRPKASRDASGPEITLTRLFHGSFASASMAPTITLESRSASPRRVMIGVNLSEAETSETTIVNYEATDDPLSIKYEKIVHHVPRSQLPILLEANRFNDYRLASWWDSVSLTSSEARVIECLELISPIERVAYVSHPFSTEHYDRGRMAMVKLRDAEQPQPLKSLGDGVSHMFSMALALEIARESGMLLIDEIENGIHYSLLPDFWRFLFEATAQSGVQLFATSHSWDCIEAFQQAASEEPGAGVLVKLARREGKVAATVFEDEDLAIATREGIELR
ncbi:AAA family ATPase [Pseudenhygromyxa sp. WMMC2535]|uniref:AAA family ATPase n=1 Tax=Pseudenhygromyxa sp. WMMC2535 TaxID=2712867 RepID=UPI00155329F1|nr:ATP-binding protein [Pseudenhygromyxa sp. WMMC2535]NVB38347.1 AAA family ATPase [Pseudenhygromyxa sp. WMMC2535]